MKIRTRFAPSPTGSLHIGGIRTALYDYAYAKKNGGEYILRIEDTDRKRFVEGSIEEVMHLLKVYNLAPDKHSSEKEIIEANKLADIDDSKWILNHEELEKVSADEYEHVYTQTLRRKLYQKYAIELIKKGFAYICFCSEDRLTKLREEQQAAKQKPMYDGHCRNNDFAESLKRIEKGEKFVVRLNVKAYQEWKKLDILKYDDLAIGEMNFPISEVDDQVLIKSDGLPTYHLAVVVDDHFMQITHPFRSSEWIPSTPKQIILFEELGWEMPHFVHLTAILDPEGGKLSKRKGSVSAQDFLLQGYLPEAILNFLMLLGWSSPEKREHGETEREFYSLEDFVELFDIKGFNRSNPVFNREKLLWFNQKYISQLSPDEFSLRFSNWLKEFADDDVLKSAIIEKGPDYLQDVLMLVQERVKLLSEIPEYIKPFYFASVGFDFSSVKQLKNADGNSIKNLVKEFSTELSKQDSVKKWGHENWEGFVRTEAEKFNLKAGEAFMALRVIVLGSPMSPPLFESMEIIGKAEVLERLSSYEEQ